MFNISNDISICISDNQADKLQSELYTLMMDQVVRVRQDAELNIRYLKKNETCKYLRVTNNTLDKWIKIGLPRVVIGSSVRFDRIAIDDWMTKNMRDGNMRL